MAGPRLQPKVFVSKPGSPCTRFSLRLLPSSVALGYWFSSYPDCVPRVSLTRPNSSSSLSAALSRFEEDGGNPGPGGSFSDHPSMSFIWEYQAPMVARPSPILEGPPPPVEHFRGSILAFMPK